MDIPAYQAHKVMNVYTKQLSHGKLLKKQKPIVIKSSDSLKDRIEISADGKHQAIIDKIAADIVQRITNTGPQNNVDHEIVTQPEDETGINPKATR